MDRNKIKERLELALRPAEPPTLEEVLEMVRREGVLHGPVDWTFTAAKMYFHDKTVKIAETFQLSKEERKQLFDFTQKLSNLLDEAWKQTKTKLTSMYNAILEGNYVIEDKRLYASDKIWLYVDEKIGTPELRLHQTSTQATFPNILKLPLETLELFQLGWRASDEGEKASKPRMSTSQPWQIFAWLAVRYGTIRISLSGIKLRKKDISIHFEVIAHDWTVKITKEEAIDAVVNHYKNGEWAPLLTMWLGDGIFSRSSVKRHHYAIIIATKTPEKIGRRAGSERAYLVSGLNNLKKLAEVAGIYGKLLDLVDCDKWYHLQLALDPQKRNILYKKRFTIPINSDTNETFYLYISFMKWNTIYAIYFSKDPEKAQKVYKILKDNGFDPRITFMPSDKIYHVYILTKEVLKWASRNTEVKKVLIELAQHKLKHGTERQKKEAEKFLKRLPFLLDTWLFLLHRQNITTCVVELNVHLSGYTCVDF
jgi:hypothetical protein